MKVKFSPHTRDDFGKYKDYLQKLKKSSTDKYRHIKPEEEKKKLRDNAILIHICKWKVCRGQRNI